MDEYTVRINGRLVGKFADFPEATRAVETSRPSRRGNALVYGTNRWRSYECEYECLDNGATALYWRISADVLEARKAV